MGSTRLEKIKRIALDDLRACYCKKGVLASPVRFTDFWARDTFWAALGMLEVDDYVQVKSSLEIFLKYQLPNGKIPRKIAFDHNIPKYVSLRVKRKEPKPYYKSVIRKNYSVDDNLLFVIVFAEYVKKNRRLGVFEKTF